MAYKEGAYRQAEQLLQQALELWTAMEQEPYRAWVLSQLGYVRLAAGEAHHREARQYFTQALQLSLKHNLAPFALDIFAGAAELLGQVDQRQHLPELLSLAG